MPATVKARIVRVGNSQGLRIPKLMLEQAQLGTEVELELRHNTIVIRPARKARVGWAQQFRTMSRTGDDQLLDPVLPTVWDRKEWTW